MNSRNSAAAKKTSSNVAKSRAKRAKVPKLFLSFPGVSCLLNGILIMGLSTSLLLNSVAG